jgi:hypothetical protein
MLDRYALIRNLRDVAGEEPPYVEVKAGGFVAFFASELGALRVAYHYRQKRIVCAYREALRVWSVTLE